MTGADSGAGDVTKRSAPRRPLASESIACLTFALNEPIETSAAIPRTTESEYRTSLRREARESGRAMLRRKRRGPRQETGGGGSSDATEPFLSRRIRWQRPASSKLWVT